MMTKWLYDGTFDGFLSCVFDLYWQRKQNVVIRKEHEHKRGVYDDLLFMPTNMANADRVWTGLCKLLPAKVRQELIACHLSEKPGEEDNLIGYIRYVFDAQKVVIPNATNFYARHVEQLAGKVFQEQLKMERAVKFRLTRYNVHYAMISPEYNVLPLIAAHFQEHYPGLYWLIYDQRRCYGIYHNLKKVETVRLQFFEESDGRYPQAGFVWSPDDSLFQQLWKLFYSGPIKMTRRLRMQYKAGMNKFLERYTFTES
jgi:probable DNA metabolism protein